MKLYTTDFITGKEIETIQMVRGSVVFSKNVVRDVFAGLKTLVGGEIAGYTEMLNDARNIINDIRQRAKNSIDKHIGYAANQCQIALYPESDFSTKEKARVRLQWERRLEMAMEYDRFFSLRRWGIASATLNRFFEKEQNSVYGEQAYAGYYRDAHFTPAKNEYFPIPYPQMYYVPGLYTQNKNYN